MTTAPECPRGHGPMVERPGWTKEQQWCGTWFECAHQPYRCRNSCLIPSPELVAQLADQSVAREARNAT